MKLTEIVLIMCKIIVVFLLYFFIISLLKKFNKEVLLGEAAKIGVIHKNV